MVWEVTYRSWCNQFSLLFIYFWSICFYGQQMLGCINVSFVLFRSGVINSTLLSYEEKIHSVSDTCILPLIAWTLIILFFAPPQQNPNSRHYWPLKENLGAATNLRGCDTPSNIIDILMHCQVTPNNSYLTIDGICFIDKENYLCSYTLHIIMSTLCEWCVD